MDYTCGLYLEHDKCFYVKDPDKRYVTHACFFSSVQKPGNSFKNPAYGKISTLIGTQVHITIESEIVIIPNDRRWFFYVGDEKIARAVCIAEQLRLKAVGLPCILEEEIVDSKDIILKF